MKKLLLIASLIGATNIGLFASSAVEAAIFTNGGAAPWGGVINVWMYMVEE